jgi:hypothetical protein
MARKYYDDDRKMKAVLNESRITLMTGEHAVSAETENEEINAIIIQNNLTFVVLMIFPCY